MAGNRKATHQYDDDSYMDDRLEDSLLDSPPKRNVSVNNAASHSRQGSTQQSNRQRDADRAQHEENLRQELASVRKVNEAIEGVLQSLEKAKSNVKSVNQTVNNASSLLNIWTRILSQTEHNQRLILDPSWQGASQDIADLEEEAQAKEQAAARREAEEQERRAAAARKAEDEERRKAEAASNLPKAKTGARGRGGLSRGSGAGRAGYVTMGGPATSTTEGSSRSATSTRRTTSGLGRGTASRNARARG